MAKSRTSYVTKQELESEIIASKAIKRLHPDWTVAQCFTPKLTEYLVLLVDRYAKKAQWRGYCLCQESEILSNRGWLSIDELTTDDLVLSCDGGQLKWSRVHSIFRDNYEGNMHHLKSTHIDALVTPKHKFLTTAGLKSVEQLTREDKLVLMGLQIEAPGRETYTDDFVELVGWTVTEGNFQYCANRTYPRITLHQNEGGKAHRIRSCLAKQGIKYSEYSRARDSEKTQVAFHLTQDLCLKLAEVVHDKIPTTNFILALTEKQRHILIDTMIAGDGWMAEGKYRGYSQVNKKQIDVFTMLCTLVGFRTKTSLSGPSGYGKKPVFRVSLLSANNNITSVRSICFDGKNLSDTTDAPTVAGTVYKGRVWCPETEFGCFVARRNGSVYLTGNSYVQDMKADAMMTLCQNIFKYDETRFDNPFGYATQIVKYCFITFLEKEEIVRDIKDSLWESIGMTPSYARQIRNEMMKDMMDQSSKGLKALKKDVEILNLKIEALGSIASRLNKTRSADLELDFEISETLEMEHLPYTSEIESTLLLFVDLPEYTVETITVDGADTDCISVYDASTMSRTKRVLATTDHEEIVVALCSIGLSVRRDLLVKRLREISGYNLTSTRIPAAERISPTDDITEETTAYPTPAKKRKSRKKPPE